MDKHQKRSENYSDCGKCGERLKIGDEIISLVVADEIITGDDEVETNFDQELVVFHKKCSPFKDVLFE